MSSFFYIPEIKPSSHITTKQIRENCVTLSNLKLLLFWFFLFQNFLLNKIDICKSRIENLNTREFLCLQSIKSMELLETTELLRRFSVCALSKIHLDSYRSICKILLILSWSINLNLGQSMEFKMKICFMYFCFMIVFFMETAFTII